MHALLPKHQLQLVKVVSQSLHLQFLVQSMMYLTEDSTTQEVVDMLGLLRILNKESGTSTHLILLSLSLKYKHKDKEIMMPGLHHTSCKWVQTGATGQMLKEAKNTLATQTGILLSPTNSLLLSNARLSEYSHGHGLEEFVWGVKFMWLFEVETKLHILN